MSTRDDPDTAELVRRAGPGDEDASFLPDRSACLLAGHLVFRRSGPRQQFLRKELQQRLQQALARLDVQDQEILVMRHLEQMTVSEIAAALSRIMKEECRLNLFCEAI